MSWLRSLRRRLRLRRPSHQGAPTPASQATTPESALPTVVGLDFGTSGTKVVVRMLGKGRPAAAIDFGTDQAGFSRFSLPSTIALDGSRFVFGTEAEKHQGGLVFRSLKRALIGTSGPARRTRLPQRPPRPDDLEAHPHFLVAVYLGWVLRHVRELVSQEFDPDSQFLYNLDIPVAQVDRGSVQRGFQTALDAAVDFAETEDLRLDDYRALWGRWRDVLRKENTGRPDHGSKRWELVPESSAILKGAETALALILPDSQRYTAIVDIGAGTTDVVWFRWVTREEGDHVYFYSAKICPVGCDDVDDRLLDILEVAEDDRPRLFPRVREAKSELRVGGSVAVGEGYRSLSQDDLSRAANEVARRCFEEYGVSFGSAYKKEKNTTRWKDIRVILVGGGSLLDGFRGQFRRHPRSFGHSVNLLLPGSSESGGFATNTLGVIGAASEPPVEADIVFLLPALGLSYAGAEGLDSTPPDDILPLPPRPKGPTGVYDYEAPEDD